MCEGIHSEGIHSKGLLNTFWQPISGFTVLQTNFPLISVMHMPTKLRTLHPEPAVPPKVQQPQVKQPLLALQSRLPHRLPSDN